MKRFVSFLLIFILVIFCVPNTAFASQDKAPILIQGAMDVETEWLIESIDEPQELIIAGYRFVKGYIEEYPVIISKTQVGMVNAATSTTVAIMTWNPKLVVNQGTAGGHDLELHRGDIVIGKSVVNINSFRSPFAEEGAGIDPTKWENRTTEILIDGQIEKVMELHSDADLLQIALSVSYEKGNVVEGVIGSGDVWNKEIDRIKLINSQFSTSCEEMETFAVAQVCAYFGTQFLGIRVLSNNELHQEDFEPETAIDCQEYVFEVVKEIIKTY